MKYTFAVFAILISAVAAWSADTKAPKTALHAGGSYQVRNKAYGDLLRPENANSAVGTPIVLYPAQPWKCMTWKLQAAGETRFQLQNHFTAKTFSANAGEGEQRVSQVVLSKDAGQNPTWEFTRLADGSYKITDAKSGKALTAVKDETGSGTRIVTKAWEDKDQQKWEVMPIDPKQLTM